MLTQDQKNVMRAYNQAQLNPIASGETNSALSEADAATLINDYLDECIADYGGRSLYLPGTIDNMQKQLETLQSQLATVNTVLASAKAVKATLVS